MVQLSRDTKAGQPADLHRGRPYRLWRNIEAGGVGGTRGGGGGEPILHVTLPSAQVTLPACTVLAKVPRFDAATLRTIGVSSWHKREKP